MKSLVIMLIYFFSFLIKQHFYIVATLHPQSFIPDDILLDKLSLVGQHILLRYMQCQKLVCKVGLSTFIISA